MKPLVVNPHVTLEQLVKEVLEGNDDEMRRAALDELLAKLQRKKRVLEGDSEARFATAAGMNVAELASFLKHETVVDRAALDAGQFKTDGGSKRLDKVFDGTLQSTEVRPAPVEGRFVARARHRGVSWEVVLEPDEQTRTVVVVTANAKMPW